MKKRFLILLIAIIIMPFKVFASGGFSVSPSSISMYPGESRTVTINSDNSVGKLNISSANSGIASVSTGSVFIQTPGSSQSFVISAGAVGATTISVVASNDYATMDEEILVGQTKTITVNIINRSTENNNNNNNNNNNSNNNNNNNHSNNNADTRSNNNNIKEISVDGYELVKVDNNNYTLSVPNDVTSINVKASAEDSKSKVTGAGTHDINVGENNIEVIVTAENGAQNKINIKVTRKDGYYLEDLESVLKNNKNDDISIIIKSDTKITAQDLEKIKNSRKKVKFNYYNDDKKLIYSWIVNGSKLKNTNNLATTITNDSENKKDILRLSNYADGLCIGLKQTSNLPAGSKLKLFVGDKYKDNDLVNIYGYIKNNDKLELVKNNIKVENGYIEFDVTNVSDYFVTMSTIPGSGNAANVTNKTSSLVLLIIIGILSLSVIGLVIAFIMKNKKNKKDDNNNNNNIANENKPINNNCENLTTDTNMVDNTNTSQDVNIIKSNYNNSNSSINNDTYNNYNNSNSSINNDTYNNYHN